MASIVVDSSDSDDTDNTSLSEGSSLFNEEEDVKEFHEELKSMTKDIKVLCAGPTGVGKSTLLNSLMGIEDSVSSDNPTDEDSRSRSSFTVQDSLDRGTLCVGEKTFTKNDIEVTLFDTPGLEGCNDADNAYLHEIKEKCADFDIFLYCINCNEAKATELFDEKSSLVKFTRMFGNKLWDHAVIALTQANVLEAVLQEEMEMEDSSLDVEECFSQKIDEWREKIRKELRKLGVKKKKVRKLPILPTGACCSPHLPGITYWLGQLFERVADQMKYKAKMAYLQLSKDRLVKHEEANAASFTDKKNSEQPFVVSLGGEIGATIGAVLIGIPSFGLFAGIGLDVGEAVGEAVIGRAALATTMAFHFFKQKLSKKRKKKICCRWIAMTHGFAKFFLN